MLINPDDYTFSEEEIREAFNLLPEDRVEQYGYEKCFSESVIEEIKKEYTLDSLKIRLRPDWKITKVNSSSYLVESKKKDNFLEVMQLLFNQLSEEMVYYLLPNDIIIKAEEIEINKIYIPLIHKDEFENNLKGFVINILPNVELIYMPNNRGSGDPYIRLDEAGLGVFEI